MAGFSKIFCAGSSGGFMGADGVNPIVLQILVGEGNRQWLEPHYFDASLRPLGTIRSIVPKGPNDPGSLLDACIAFLPDHFEGCPSLGGVKKELANTQMLDFDLGADKIPKAWEQLRREALPRFKELEIWEAELRSVDLSRVG